MSHTISINHLTNPVILFDGVCNLCSGAVQFVLKRDKKDLFRFASLQSPFGEAVLEKYGLNKENFSSFILLHNDQVYTQSTAALLVAKRLSGWIRLLYAFMIIPKFIRDFVYNTIARNRYKWFGKKETCWLPVKEYAIKFF